MVDLVFQRELVRTRRLGHLKREHQTINPRFVTARAANVHIRIQRLPIDRVTHRIAFRLQRRQTARITVQHVTQRLVGSALEQSRYASARRHTVIDRIKDTLRTKARSTVIVIQAVFIDLARFRIDFRRFGKIVLHRNREQLRLARKRPQVHRIAVRIGHIDQTREVQRRDRIAVRTVTLQLRLIVRIVRVNHMIQLVFQIERPVTCPALDRQTEHHTLIRTPQVCCGDQRFFTRDARVYTIAQRITTRRQAAQLGGNLAALARREAVAQRLVRTALEQTRQARIRRTVSTDLLDLRRICAFLITDRLVGYIAPRTSAGIAVITQRILMHRTAHRRTARGRFGCQRRNIVLNGHDKCSDSINGIQIIIESLNDTCEVQLHDLVVVAIVIGMVQLIQQRERVVARFRIGYLDPENIASTCCAAIDHRLAHIIEKHLAVLGVDIVSTGRPDRVTVDSCLECIAARLIGTDAEQTRYVSARHRILAVTVTVTIRQLVFVNISRHALAQAYRNIIYNSHSKTGADRAASSILDGKVERQHQLVFPITIGVVKLIKQGKSIGLFSSLRTGIVDYCLENLLVIFRDARGRKISGITDQGVTIG